MNRLLIILTTTIALNISGLTQNLESKYFYKHFSGQLDTNMFLTMDLFSQNGKISGFHYYFFEIQGDKAEFHFGKTIPIEGTFNGNTLVLHEFGNTDSKFTATINDNFDIDGNWQRRQYENPIKFNLSEDYTKGSIPLKCYYKDTDHFLNLENVPRHATPYAKINIVLLYPESFFTNSFKETYDLAISTFYLNDTLLIKSPELLIENITFDYIQSYVTATNGIPNIEQTSSFNWVKKLGMSVIYNQNNILTIRYDKYGYAGGAHGVSISKFKVFNLTTGNEYTHDNIFKPGYEKSLNRILERKLRQLNGIKKDENLRESGFFIDHVEFNDNIYITNDGIGFFYNVYEIASYAAGSTELFCSFKELKDILIDDHPFIWISE